MTHRSRSGGPTKTRSRKATHQRKLHHPPPPPASNAAASSSSPIVEGSPLPTRNTPFNPPDSEILALLHRALHSTLSDESFNPTVQKIKGLLFDKKWLEVFTGNEALLEAYAGRWVPSRACCFRELIDALAGESVFSSSDGTDGREAEAADRLGHLALDDVDEGDEESVEEQDRDEHEPAHHEEATHEAGPDATSANPGSGEHAAKTADPHHILSLGGGAGSELLAISALIRSVLLTRPHSHPSWSWTGVDIGTWHKVVQKLTDAVRVDWGIEGNVLDVEYVQGDLVAQPSNKDDAPVVSEYGPQIPAIDLVPILKAKTPRLITLLFTLTELLAQSRAQTLSLLAELTAHTAPGTLFLIADSASDISDFCLGAEGRKYPVWMIVDVVLTSKGKGWERVQGEDSRWFRFDDGVGAGWPCKLENTRYWYSLYKRI